MAREIAKEVKIKGPEGKKGVCILYTDGTIFVEWVRFSYPHLLSPYKREDDEGKPAFSVIGMLGKDTHAKAIELIDNEIARILRDNKVKKLKQDRLFMRDGDDAEQEEYEGFMTLSAREQRRPPLRNVDGSKLDPDNKKHAAKIEELFVGGHWGALLLRPWYMNNKFGKRVNAGLSSAQFLMKDETFGQGRLSEEDLDDTFRSHGAVDDDDDDDGGYDDEDDDDDFRRRSKKRKASRDDDDDDDEDDRRSRKSKKRKSRDDDDDDDDDDI